MLWDKLKRIFCFSGFETAGELLVQRSAPGRGAVTGHCHSIGSALAPCASSKWFCHTSAILGCSLMFTRGSENAISRCSVPVGSPSSCQIVILDDFFFSFFFVKSQKSHGGENSPRTMSLGGKLFSNTCKHSSSVMFYLQTTHYFLSFFLPHWLMLKSNV